MGLSLDFFISDCTWLSQNHSATITIISKTLQHLTAGLNNNLVSPFLGKQHHKAHAIPILPCVNTSLHLVSLAKERLLTNF